MLRYKTPAENIPVTLSLTGQLTHLAMAPKVKITYFNLRGRAEPSRLLLAYGGIKYEDCRVTPAFQDPTEWQALKPKTPYGSLPLLEWDGTCIAQSMAVARFIAREVGLAGKCNMESAQIDEIIDAINDMVNAGARAFFSKDEAQMKKHATETIPAGLCNIEKRLECRGGQFLVGNAFSWADLHLFDFCFNLPDKSCLDKYPKIKNLTERVACIPNIKCWVESRPKTNL